MPECDKQMVADNSYAEPEIIAIGNKQAIEVVSNLDSWTKIMSYGN